MQTSCEACGGRVVEGLKLWHKRCTDCGLETSQLTGFITDRKGVDIDEDAREQALRPLRERNFDTLLDWTLQHLDKHANGAAKPRLLEVGCAHGWFIEKAARAFEVIGIEPDDAVATRTLARGLPVRRGYFPDALAADEMFDVIVFNDVLEHIPSVGDALRHCVRHLRPSGVIVVNAPDRRGALYRLSTWLVRVGMSGPFERLWQKGLPSPHLYYFDSRSLASVAGSAGLEVVACRRLPSLTARGLYSRIRCAGDVPAPKALVLAAGVLPLVPLLHVLPSDIRVWLLSPGQLGN
jgi:SAM-dependent methyltransferase